MLPPRFFNPQPNVPPELAGRDQFADIVVLVDRKGRPKDVALRRFSDKTFGELCIDVVKTWTFTPGVVDGKPADVKIMIPFRLRAADANQS